ncbi:hypothetical protein [Chryseobacterium proteolyticum]|uniref:hypothetical protein n=1 Tax=Chryseobacterium proteolyticum TaxID=118127 RepID=UPI003983D80A
MEEQSIGVQLIAQERQKQIDKYGFTAQYSVEHPEYYENKQLQQAALILTGLDYAESPVTPDNWDPDRFTKLCNENRKERLIIAGALIAAELDRLSELEN